MAAAVEVLEAPALLARMAPLRAQLPVGAEDELAALYIGKR